MGPKHRIFGLDCSVTILRDLLHFGQLFKVCGNNYLAQIAHILGNFCKGVKIFHFSGEIIFGQFFRHFLTFYWSHWTHEGGQATLRQYCRRAWVRKITKDKYRKLA